MSYPEIDVNAIRRRVEKRLKDRAELIQHIVAYVIVNAGLWALYIGTNSPPEPDDNFIWPIIPSAAWGFGLLMHIIDYVTKHNREQAVELAVQREIQMLQTRLGLSDAEMHRMKRKNESVRLTDDGELADDSDYDENDAVIRKSRS